MAPTRLGGSSEKYGIIKGCWQMSGGHGTWQNPRDAIDDLLLFAESGIVSFDCADIYTGVEEMIGTFRSEAKARNDRELLDSVRVHTKFVPDLDVLPKIDRKYVVGIIDRSLMRLHMEALDLVQFHWWNYGIPGYLETAGFLQELKAAGKIRQIGLTNFNTARLKEIVESGVEVVSNQVQYSVIDTRPEHEMSEYCLLRGIQLLCYGTIAGGFLSEQYLHAPEPSGERPNRSLTKYQLLVEDIGGWSVLQTLLGTLHAIARSHDALIGDVAAAFVRQQPAVGAVILGASARHLDGVERLKTLTLTDTELLSIRADIRAANSLAGDVYDLERVPGKHSAIMRYNLNK